MTDPYQVLGVSRTATAEEIRKAYRRLAKKSHPDLHPGDKAAEARFKEISAAYAIVGDETKRGRFDRGEIDASGAEQPSQQERDFYRRHAEAGPGFKYQRRWDGEGQPDLDDAFADLFGARRAGSRGTEFKMRGPDIHYALTVDFLEAVNGAKKRVVMGDGKALDLGIPPGLKDGQMLRLRGQGRPGIGGGEVGDALVEIHVTPHPVFRRDGQNIRSTLPVTLKEALAGAKLWVQTVSGAVELTIPKGSNTGSVLRLRGKGVPGTGGTAGDHLMELQVFLPEAPDDELVRFATEWEAKHPYVPRQGQGARA